MCYHCTLAALPQTDEGAVWPEITDAVRHAASLVDRFMHLPGMAGSGGPLHCSLEDANLDDGNLRAGCGDQDVLARYKEYFRGSICYTSAFDGGERAYSSSEVEQYAKDALGVRNTLLRLTGPERHVAVDIGQGVMRDYGAAWIQELDEDERAIIEKHRR